MNGGSRSHGGTFGLTEVDLYWDFPSSQEFIIKVISALDGVMYREYRSGNDDCFESFHLKLCGRSAIETE